MFKFLIRFVIIALCLLGIFSLLVLKHKERPKILLITIETTRADHLSCYGYARKTSPAIDKLAQEGVLFVNMFAQRGLTWPSLTSIMTSLYPVNHKVRDNGELLPETIISLAEILKGNGYTTAAFLSHAGSAVWRGFDHKVKMAYRDSEITRQAIEWLKSNYKKDFFVWLHYFQPHDPYTPPAPYDKVFDPKYSGNIDGSRKMLAHIFEKKIKLSADDLNHIISLYDGSILFIDDKVKELLDCIKRLGIEDDTLIIVTADHGEALYRQFYFGHDACINDDALHIPCIMKFSNRLPKNRKIREVVESINIAPTILELIGIDIPGYFEGKSMLALIFSRHNPGDFLYAYSEWLDKILSIRTAKYRYIFNPHGVQPYRRGGDRSCRFMLEEEELYEVQKMPEEINISDEKPHIAYRLKKKLKEWKYFQSWTSGYNMPRPKEIPEKIKEELKSLGYL